MKLARLSLRVADPARLAAFYRDQLGLADLGGDLDSRRLRATPESAEVELTSLPAAAAPYSHSRSDVYWKIGLTLPALAPAVARLRAAGVSASEPRQFRDIGCLCHLADPEGFQIELLQQTFAGREPAGLADAHHPLGAPATLGQVTLRVLDIERNLDFYRDRLGLTLLSVQPVAPMGFTLYFLAGTDERPPDPDLEAVANREWLWQRPYSTLELQHLWGEGAALRALPAADEPGLDGLVFTGADLEGVARGEATVAHDPQGVPITLCKS